MKALDPVVEQFESKQIVRNSIAWNQELEEHVAQLFDATVYELLKEVVKELHLVNMQLLELRKKQ